MLITNINWEAIYKNSLVWYDPARKRKKNQQKNIDNNNIICVYASTLLHSENAVFCLFCFVFFAEYKCYKLVKTKWCMKKTILVDVNLLFSENVFVITH